MKEKINFGDIVKNSAVSTAKTAVVGFVSAVIASTVCAAFGIGEKNAQKGDEKASKRKDKEA